jgi:hypothetical protein
VFPQSTGKGEQWKRENKTAFWANSSRETLRHALEASSIVQATLAVLGSCVSINRTIR